MKKVYFCHYGQVYSLSEKDAIKFAQDAIQAGRHSFSAEKYKSFRILKLGYELKATTFKRGKSYAEVHHCLDWNPEDWTNFLKYDMKIGNATDSVLTKEKKV